MSPSKYQPRWWFYPSWLGLDAPFVVTTWTIAISLANGERVEPVSIIALWSTVWLIYLGDRLYDVAHCRDWSHAPGRMAFGKTRRRTPSDPGPSASWVPRG